MGNKSSPFFCWDLFFLTYFHRMTCLFSGDKLNYLFNFTFCAFLAGSFEEYLLVKVASTPPITSNMW